jgi:hypothetical protein
MKMSNHILNKKNQYKTALNKNNAKNTNISTSYESKQTKKQPKIAGQNLKNTPCTKKVNMKKDIQGDSTPTMTKMDNSNRHESEQKEREKTSNITRVTSNTNNKNVNENNNNNNNKNNKKYNNANNNNWRERNRKETSQHNSEDETETSQQREWREWFNTANIRRERIRKQQQKKEKEKIMKQNNNETKGNINNSIIPLEVEQSTKANNTTPPEYKNNENNRTTEELPPPKDHSSGQVNDTPQATACSVEQNNHYCFISQNVRGMRDANDDKLEHIVRLMHTKDIDCYLIQETHRAGNFTQTLKGGYTFIHHGPEEQPLSGTKGGVAIVLSKEFSDMWRKGGSKIKYGTLHGGTARLLRVDIEVTNNNSIKSKHDKRANSPKPREEKNKERKNKGKRKTIDKIIFSLITSYHPHTGYKDEEAEEYNQIVMEMCENCPKEATIIMGADVNAALGTSKLDSQETDPEDPTSILGPHGIQKRNERGEAILNMARTLDLRVATSYYQQTKGSGTWIHPATKQRYQPDHFFISRKSCANMTDARKRYDGAPDSDHLAITIKLKRMNKLDTKKKNSRENLELKTHKKIDYNILRKNDAKEFKLSITDFIKNNEQEKREESEGSNLENNHPYGESASELLEHFEQHTVEATKKIAEVETKERADWFTESELELTMRIYLRNRAYKIFEHTNTETAKTELKRQRALLQIAKRKAKRKWQKNYVDKCQTKKLQKWSKRSMGNGLYFNRRF